MFDTRGAQFDTLLAVYRGTSVPALGPVASNDDSGSGRTSRVMFNATAGAVYRIAVDGKNGETGVVTLNWRRAMNLGPVTRVGDTFQFELAGQMGDRYVIESSLDLVEWSLWQRATNSTGVVQISDPDLHSNPHQFFRARTE